MIAVKPPTYEELERRLIAAEGMLEAIRSGQAKAAFREHAALASELAEAQARAAHIKQLLLAIRNVNHLIVRETDRFRLIELTCANLTEPLGYHNAWIALLEDTAINATITAASGFQDGFVTMRESLARGELPACMTKAIAQDRVVLIEQPQSQCQKCPYSMEYADRAALVGPLAFAGKHFGVLVVSVPAAYAVDQEEQSLFAELAGDISFALHKIEMEERRQETEQGLKEQEELLRATGRMARVGGWELDAETMQVSWTEETYRIHELPLDYQPTLEEAINFFHEDDRAVLKQAIQRALQCGESYDMELRFISATGRHLWTHTACRPEVVNGKTVRLRGTFQDITVRKQAQEELRESEEHYRHIVETAIEGIWQMDGQFRTTFVNRRMAEMLGYTVDEMLGRSVDSFMFDEDLADHMKKMRSRIRGEDQSYERRFRKKDSAAVWMTITATSLKDHKGNFAGSFAMLTDITEHRKVQEALRRSEKRLRLAMEATQDALWDWDMTTGDVFCSDRFYEMLGCPRENFSEKVGDWHHLVVPEDYAAVQRGLQKYLTGQDEKHEVEFRVIKPSGELIWVLSRGQVVARDETGKPVRMVGTHTDVTERKRAEAALSESGERLRLAAKATNDVIWDWDVVKDQQFWNESGIVELGWEDIVHSPQSASWWTDRVHPDDRERVNQGFYAVVADASRSRWEDEYLFRKADGNYAIVLDRGYVIRDEQGRAVRMVGAMLNITERKRVEHELREANRRLNESQRIAKIGTWEWHPETDETYWSDETYRMFGLEPGSERPSCELAKRFTHPEDTEDWQRAVASALEKGDQFIHDYRAVRSDGSVIRVHNEAEIMRNSKGEVIQLLGTAQDVTEQKRVEQSLRQSEDRYKQISECSLTGIFIHQDGKGVYVNQRLADMLGYSKEEMIGRPFLEAVHPIDRKMVLNRATGRLNGEQKPVSYELRLLKKTGEELWCEVLATVINYNGRPAIMGNIADLTARKAAEQQRIDAHRRLDGALKLLESVISAVPIPLFFKDLQGRYLGVNEAFSVLLGFAPDYYKGKTVMELWPSDYAALYHQKDLELMRNPERQVYQFKVLDRSGKIRPALWSKSVFYDENGHVAGIVGAFQDISERLLAEEALRESEARVRTKLQSILCPEGDVGVLELPDVIDIAETQSLMDDFYSLTKIGMGIFDLQGKVWVSTGWQDICTRFHRVHLETRQNCIASDTELCSGVEEGTFKLFRCLNNMWDIATPIVVGGRHLGNLILGQFLFADEEPDHEIFRSQARKYGFDEADYMAALERLPRWNRETVQRVMGFYSKFTRMLSTLSYSNIKLARSLAEQERLLSSLRESEDRYRAVVNNLHIGISVINRNMEIVAINPFFGAYYPNVRPGEGQVCFAMYNDPPRSSPCSYCPCVLTFQDGKVHECETDTPAGDQIRHYRIVSCPVKDEHGEVELVIELVEDITERRSLQAQLLQAQKMEAIGTLAGGVAHDFNNILQIMMGYCELILSDDELSDRYRKDLRQVHEAVFRGADLVRRLLTFSRKTEFNPQPVDLNVLIKDLRRMLERTLPKMVDLQLIQDVKPARINADKTQIDQILINLAVNARDAMPDGGRLSFETANVILDEEYARTNVGSKPGPHVLLTVTDTGSGMDEKTLEHIFEPFYSTKPVGEGTGLGLAIVHGIVTRHGGHIRCHSEPGKGTAFQIYLPAIELDELEKWIGVQEMPPGGSETVLLVDDEESVCNLAEKVLTNAGYKVITAANGREALDVYQLRANEIDLVLLDLMMPEMGGRQCLEELMKTSPSLKVLIASGYSANGSSSEALAAGAKGFVNKPYEIRQLLEIVRKVLDEE